MKSLWPVLLYLVGCGVHACGALLEFLCFGLTLPWPLPVLGVLFLIYRPLGDYRNVAVALFCLLPLLSYPLKKWGNSLRRRGAGLSGQHVYDLN